MEWELVWGVWGFVWDFEKELRWGDYMVVREWGIRIVVSIECEGVDIRVFMGKCLSQ